MSEETDTALLTVTYDVPVTDPDLMGDLEPLEGAVTAAEEAGLDGELRGIGRTDVRIPTYNRSMPELVAPPGWPRQVRPPGAPGWERTAVAWLLDVCPPEYRSYPALRRHDVILARFAVLHVEACQAAVQRGLSEARGALRDVADLDAVEAAVETWQAESARLLAERRAVGLVEEALRGKRFVARL